MIVKVQIPLATNAPTPMALIYNEDRSVEYQTPVTRDLRRKMKGQWKTFMHAELVDTILHLGKMAPWQDW